MGKRIGFAVAKTPSGSWNGKDVFHSLSGSGRTIEVMSAASYAKAAKRADKSLASAVIAGRQVKKT